VQAVVSASHRDVAHAMRSSASVAIASPSFWIAAIAFPRLRDHLCQRNMIALTLCFTPSANST
jgi:hypothetical protein